MLASKCVSRHSMAALPGDDRDANQRICGPRKVPPMNDMHVKIIRPSDDSDAKDFALLVDARKCKVAVRKDGHVAVWVLRKEIPGGSMRDVNADRTRDMEVVADFIDADGVARLYSLACLDPSPVVALVSRLLAGAPPGDDESTFGRDPGAWCEEIRRDAERLMPSASGATKRILDAIVDASWWESPTPDATA